MEVVPALHDRHAGAGITDEYFWQDLAVARMVHSAGPDLHVDVGSLLTGFVAHVASFREIELIDIRPLASTIPNVRFRQADMMGDIGDLAGHTDSLSCLHAIEHFGLGRYGDPLDPGGPEKGIANLAKMLKSGGTLYLSTPIGRERVEFNANWVFDPRRIAEICLRNGLQLSRLLTVQAGRVTEIDDPATKLNELAALRYALGIFVCKKAVGA